MKKFFGGAYIAAVLFMVACLMIAPKSKEPEKPEDPIIQAAAVALLAALSIGVFLALDEIGGDE